MINDSRAMSRRFDHRSRTPLLVALTARRSITVASPRPEPLVHFLSWQAPDNINAVVASPDFVSAHGTAVHVQVLVLHVVIGTSLGHVVGFTYAQEVLFVLEAGDFGAVSAMAFSSDSHFLGVGHANGAIALWDLSSTNEPHFVVFPISLENRFTRNSQGHVLGTAVNSISFIDDLHNKLVTSDESGLVFFHVGVHKFLNTYFTTQKLLGVNDANINDGGKYHILDCKLLPLGTSHQITDHLGLLAVMTANVLVITTVLSLNNSHTLHPKLQLKVGRPRDHVPTSGCMSWFPCMEGDSSKLAYAWDNRVVVLDMHNEKFPDLVKMFSDLKDKDKALPRFPVEAIASYKAEGPVVSIEWVSHNLLVIGITGMKMVALYLEKSKLVEVGSDTLPPVDTSPSSHPSYNRIRFLKNRFVVLGSAGLQIGRFVTWADQLLQYLAAEDYPSALTAVTDYYTSTYDGFVVLAGLPEDMARRQATVKPYLLRIMKECVGPLFTQTFNHEVYLGQYVQMMTLLSQDEIADLLELVFEVVDDKRAYFDAVEPYFLLGAIKRVPPQVLKALVECYTKWDKGERLTEIVCVLDTATLDIDLTLTLCDKYQLWDCSVYIWNYVLHDYRTVLLDSIALHNPKVYAYMAYILTGRQYPTDRFIEDEAFARESVLEVVFADSSHASTSIFPNLHFLLHRDSFQMLSTMNEFFENPCLNDQPKINRQYIIEALLDIFDLNDFDDNDHVQLAIFLARNYPKYPQFIRLSESVMQDVIDRLTGNQDEALGYDCELALQSILPYYDGDDEHLIVEKLRAAKFYDVLINIYRSEGKYDQVLQVWLEKHRTAADLQIDTLAAVMERAFSSSAAEQLNVVEVLRANFTRFLAIDLAGFFAKIDRYCPSLHREVLRAGDLEQLEYLRLVFAHECHDPELATTFVRLLCMYDKPAVAAFVRGHLVDLKDRSALKELFVREKAVESLMLVYVDEKEFEEGLDAMLGVMPDEECFANALVLCEKAPQDASEGLSQQERLWLRLVDRLMASASPHINEAFRWMIDTKLNHGDGDIALRERLMLAILGEFLQHSTHNASAATLANVRNIFHEVFVLFAYESEILRQSRSLINSAIYKDLMQVRTSHLEGWDIRHKACAACGKTMWGPDVVAAHLEAWEAREFVLLYGNSPKSSFSCELIFFKCTHGYHSKCLVGNYQHKRCILCVT